MQERSKTTIDWAQIIVNWRTKSDILINVANSIYSHVNGLTRFLIFKRNTLIVHCKTNVVGSVPVKHASSLITNRTTHGSNAFALTAYGHRINYVWDPFGFVYIRLKRRIHKPVCIIRQGDTVNCIRKQSVINCAHSMFSRCFSVNNYKPINSRYYARETLPRIYATRHGESSNPRRIHQPNNDGCRKTAYRTHGCKFSIVKN